MKSLLPLLFAFTILCTPAMAETSQMFLENDDAVIFHCAGGKIDVDEKPSSTDYIDVVSCGCETPNPVSPLLNISNYAMACHEVIDVHCDGMIYPIYMGIYGTTARTLCSDVGIKENIYLPIIQNN